MYVCVGVGVSVCVHVHAIAPINPLNFMRRAILIYRSSAILDRISPRCLVSVPIL